ncbi:hypothetical protein BDW02DRAFT_504298 [Decorospora gaudefroyi]|uniref:RRM domain-containing protein n=1 Tax=Decorospora gaudefroyi TaxID=184978 RepID=A0A6A5K670_9PLEO|nr:hypothetical protein BDW02DRAFT_504298 [Decorospora gaudefroyi]
MEEAELDKFMEEMTGRSHSGTPPTRVLQADPETRNSKKRKNVTEQEVIKKPKVHENRAIWISNLPPDTTVEELHDEFAKFGIIDKGADGKPRIRLGYDKKTGEFDRTALITYFRKESIRNAIDMKDDYYLRPGDYSSGKINVYEADFDGKKEKDGDAIASKLSRQDRKALERNRAELNRKLAEWSDNEEEAAQVFAPKKNKWAKVVIIKKVFTLKSLEADERVYLECKEDMRSAAEKFGEVTNCTIYDKEPEGIVTVRFREFEAAEQFCKHPHPTYNKRHLELSLAEEKPKFQKSAREEEPDSQEEEIFEKEAVKKEEILEKEAVKEEETLEKEAVKA